MKSLPLILLAAFVLAFSFLNRSCCDGRENVETALIDSARTSIGGQEGIQVTADHYNVNLEGTVASQDEKDRIGELVQADLPAGNVNNLLKIGAGAAAVAAVPTVDADAEATKLAAEQKAAEEAKAAEMAAMKAKEEEEAARLAALKAEEEAKAAEMAAAKAKAEEEARLAALRAAEEEKAKMALVEPTPDPVPVPPVPPVPTPDPDAAKMAAQKAAEEAKAAEMAAAKAAEEEKARMMAAKAKEEEAARMKAAEEEKARMAKLKADEEAAAKAAEMAAAKKAEEEAAAKKAAEMAKAKPEPAPAPATKVTEAPKRVELSGALANDIANIPAIYFRAGHVCVDPPDMWKVNQAAAALKAAGNDDVISVIGYSDPRGNIAANRKMAYRRAAEVRNLLITKGVRRENIRTINGGLIGDLSDPASYTPEATAEARKVELRLGE